MKGVPTFIFHLPLEAVPFSFFDIGKQKTYFQTVEPSQGCDNLVILIEHLEKNKSTCNVHFTGTYLQWLEQEHQEIIEKIKSLLTKGKITLIGGTYYHSMFSVISIPLFLADVKRLNKLYKETFNQKPEIFKNTLNIYYNDLASVIYDQGFTTFLASANSWHVNNRNSDQGFMAVENIPLAIKLLPIENQFNGYGIDHYRDYETFTPEDFELIGGKRKTKNNAIAVYNVPYPIGHQSQTTSIDNLVSNPLQRAIVKQIQAMEKSVIATNKETYLNDLLLLGSFDFLDKINIKKYPDLAHQTFIEYTNMLADLELKITSK